MSLASQIASETVNIGKLKAKKAPQEEIDKAEQNLAQMKDKMKVLGTKLGENAEVFSSLMAEKILSKIQELKEKYNVPVKDEILEQIRTAIKAAVEAMVINSPAANASTDSNSK
jgi:ribosomal protein L9